MTQTYSFRRFLGCSRQRMTQLLDWPRGLTSLPSAAAARLLGEFPVAWSEAMSIGRTRPCTISHQGWSPEVLQFSAPDRDFHCFHGSQNLRNLSSAFTTLSIAEVKSTDHMLHLDCSQSTPWKEIKIIRCLLALMPDRHDSFLDIQMYAIRVLYGKEA